jgi:hypothetical protein
VRHELILLPISFVNGFTLFPALDAPLLRSPQVLSTCYAVQRNAINFGLIFGFTFHASAIIRVRFADRVAANAGFRIGAALTGHANGQAVDYGGAHLSLPFDSASIFTRINNSDPIRSTEK